MANVTFKLRSPKGTIPQMIYLVYRFGQNEKLAYSTLLKVAPPYWNAKKMRVREVVECLDRDTINNYLNKLQAVTEAYITSLKTHGKKITKDTIKQFLDSYTNNFESSESKLHLFIIDFLAKNKTRVNPQTGKIITYRACNEHERSYFYLKDFETKERKGIKLDFDDINSDFYEDFTKYLQKIGLSVNTIGKRIKTLKVWLNDATEKGINTNMHYKSRSFKTPTEDVENIYLSNNELKALYEHEFNNERLTRVRDLFLIGAFTGLRFSDFTTITENNIKNNTLRIEQQKTGKPVSIPLHPIVSEIWQKYNQSLPERISNQKFNEYIKEVCKLAEIDSPEEKHITKGGMRVKHVYKKYELVSSHTARRSFATNLYLSGFPTLSIMQITGHKTETAFMKYIKVTSEQHADLLRKHWAKTGEFMRIAK